MRILLILLTVFASQFCFGQRFTPLRMDNHPCKAENLKLTNRYICNALGEVFCQNGWKEPDNVNLRDMLNPCPEPICDQNGLECEHGVCKAPNFCTCEIGWEGSICDQCINLPGCVHGNCTEALECNCFDGWEGGFCDIPHCSSCENGVCESPETCVCHQGWSGPSCDVCQTLPGCLHGQCGDHPNSCECDAGWEGHLCDQPHCDFCEHGTCVDHPNGNICICEPGWSGESCDRCVPYWECPETNVACVNPNECICTTPGLLDPKGICGHQLLHGNR